jgi:ATPase family AAA domain-containing protein 3A/B
LSNHATRFFSARLPQVIEITRKQEETRQAEEKTKQESFRAQQAQADIERQRVAFEEQRKLNQQQAQNKAQMLRYEDELARKRMQNEHEAQRQRNAELVKVTASLAADKQCAGPFSDDILFQSPLRFVSESVAYRKWDVRIRTELCPRRSLLIVNAEWFVCALVVHNRGLPM